MEIYNVGGAGDVYLSPEHTSTKIKEEYERWMKDIKSVFDKDPALWTEQDYWTVQNALDGLDKLSKTVDNTSPGGPYGLTRTMYDDMKSVFDFLKTAGLEAGGRSDPQTALKLMKILKEWEGQAPGEAG